MKAIDLMKAAWDMSHAMVLPLIEDMKDHATTAPTPSGGNHPLWVLGHLTFSQGRIRQIMLGEPNPIEAWQPLFKAGTQPVADAGHYPPFDEILAKYKELYTTNRAFLDSLSDDDLDTPSANAPEGFEKFFGTYGQCLLLVVMNQMHHRGQLADARRAANRGPLTI